MSPTHKKLLSTIFYITLGVLSVSSTFPLIGRWLLVDPSTDGLFDLINKVSLVWITFRALAMATATAAITKARQEEYLISQVRNEQVDLNMLLIIPAAVLFSYMLLRKDSDGATAIILSYFYTNTGIIFFERLVGKKPS